METYAQMKSRHQKEFNEFPMGAAFSDDQFKVMMEKWGLNPDKDLDKILSIGAGCFIRKSDRQAFHDIMDRFERETKELKKDHKRLQEMFEYEMANHEYCISYDMEEVLEACDIEPEEFANDFAMGEIWKRAKKNYLQNVS